MLAFTIGTAVVTVFLDGFVPKEAWQLAVSMSVALVFLAAVSATFPALLAELFPTHVRAVAVAFPYSVAVALFGGTAPLLRQWLAEHDHAELFTWYTLALLATTLATIAGTPESKGRPLADIPASTPAQPAHPPPLPR